MKLKHVSLFFFLFFTLYALSKIYYFSSKSERKSTINQLIELLNKEQIKKSTSFFPPISFIEDQGLYKSYVKMNFFGSSSHTLLRKYFSIPDSNMFISNFVSLALLESWELGMIELPRDQLELSLNAILNFKDKNDNSTDIYTFWPQAKGFDFFTASPLNLLYGINIFMKGSGFIQYILEKIGMEYIYNEYVEYFVQMFTIYQAAFKIPSDADDTSVNMALGSKLYFYKDDLKDLVKNWTKVNTHLNETLQAYLRYSYKPFSSNLNEAATDPRTYYYLHDYLRTKINDSNLAFINTWITNIEEDSNRAPDVGMPTHVNNVDLSVNANSLFGLSHVMIIRSELINNELLNLYSSVTDLIVWAIEYDIVLKRPDVAILYYPSIFDFYWFAARVMSFLEKSTTKLPFKEMDETKEKLAKVLREKGTFQILSLCKSDGDKIYWEEFLGVNDTHPTGEDRLFSTSLSINMLIDTWSNYTNNDLRWRNDTPQEVIELMEKAVEFLNDEILNDNYEKENAFFSASFKGNSSIPYSYPHNYMEYINGSAVNESNIDMNVSIGIKGVVDEEEYKKMINEIWFGRKVPQIFLGFNEYPFPYWSSPAMTYSLSLMGLSKYEKIRLLSEISSKDSEHLT